MSIGRASPVQVTPADGAFLSPIEPINKCNIYLDLRERNYGKSTIGYGQEPDERRNGKQATHAYIIVRFCCAETDFGASHFSPTGRKWHSIVARFRGDKKDTIYRTGRSCDGRVYVGPGAASGG